MAKINIDLYWELYLSQNVHLANIAENIILDSNFIKKNNCIIDVKLMGGEEKIRIAGKPAIMKQKEEFRKRKRMGSTLLFERFVLKKYRKNSRERDETNKTKFFRKDH